MNQIFAPWRIDWVERDDRNEDVEGCIFCAIPERETDRDDRVVARNDLAYVILNNYPYNPGHVMIIPNRHTGAFQDLDEETLLAHDRLLQRTIVALENSLEPDGINTGCNLGRSAAGGSVGDHLHTHVVPRWTGDTNFMPVIAETNVIVEALEDTYERLHDAYADLDGATVRGDDCAVEF